MTALMLLNLRGSIHNRSWVNGLAATVATAQSLAHLAQVLIILDVIPRHLDPHTGVTAFILPQQALLLVTLRLDQSYVIVFYIYTYTEVVNFNFNFRFLSGEMIQNFAVIRNVQSTIPHLLVIPSLLLAVQLLVVW